LKLLLFLLLLLLFLLIKRYVPNVAKKSIWDHCNYWGTTDRPLLSISVSIKSKMAAGCYLGKIQMAISPPRVIRSTSYLF